MAWANIWIATVVSIVSIVFSVQNTRSVEVSFLGMRGTLPLAIALVIAAVGGILLTLVVGTARITQPESPSNATASARARRADNNLGVTSSGPGKGAPR